MNKSESITKLSAALVKFQAEVTNPKNTAVNPHFKSKYAPLQDILTLVRPLLTRHGLSVIQFPSGDGERIVIQTILMHESGEWIEADPLTLKADKATPQGAGSAITYGRRYSLSAMLGISSEDDDDGNAARTPQQLTAVAKNKGVNEDGVKLLASYHLQREVTNTSDLTEQELNELFTKFQTSSPTDLAKAIQVLSKNGWEKEKAS